MIQNVIDAGGRFSRPKRSPIPANKSEAIDCFKRLLKAWEEGEHSISLSRNATASIRILENCVEADAHAATLAELQAAREEVERLRSALRPFANCALRWSGKERHDAADTFLWSPNNKEGAISVKHVLDARQALDSQPDTAGGGE